MNITAMFQDSSSAIGRVTEPLALAVARVAGTAAEFCSRLADACEVASVRLVREASKAIRFVKLRREVFSASKKLSAEALNAPSADLMCEIDANVVSYNAVHSMTNQNTEQHRCTAV
jgi:hypothetical protein